MAVSLVFANLIIQERHEYKSAAAGVPPINTDYIQSVVKSNGDYNISILYPSGLNTSETYPYLKPGNTTGFNIVENYGLNGVAQEEIPDLAIYINGTAQNVSAPLRFYLAFNNSLHVNLIVPCTSYAAGSTMNVCTWGGANGEGMWGQSIKLPN